MKSLFVHIAIVATVNIVVTYMSDSSWFITMMLLAAYSLGAFGGWKEAKRECVSYEAAST